MKTLLKKSYNAFLFIISLKNFIMKKIVVAVFFCLVQTVFAQISLPYIFSDNMVLQRGQKIPVWGFSSPNETIKVAFKKQLKVQIPVILTT